MAILDAFKKLTIMKGGENVTKAVVVKPPRSGERGHRLVHRCPHPALYSGDRCYDRPIGKLTEDGNVQELDSSYTVTGAAE